MVFDYVAFGDLHFFFLNRAGVLNIGKVDIPYPVYALLGLTIWHIFAGGLGACSW